MERLDFGKIALRAYQLWENQGSPEDRALEFWRQAEFEISSHSASPFDEPGAEQLISHPDGALDPAERARRGHDGLKDLAERSMQRVHRLPATLPSDWWRSAE